MLIQKNAYAPRKFRIFSCGNEGHTADVIELADVFEVWIHHPNYAVKGRMAAIYKKENPGFTFDEFIEVVEWHLGYYVDEYNGWIEACLGGANNAALPPKRDDKSILRLNAVSKPRHVNTLFCDDGLHAIDIIEATEEWQFWIYRRNCNPKYLMSTVPKRMLPSQKLPARFYVALADKMFEINGAKAKNLLMGVTPNEC